MSIFFSLFSRCLVWDSNPAFFRFLNNLTIDRGFRFWQCLNCISSLKSKYYLHFNKLFIFIQLDILFKLDKILKKNIPLVNKTG